MFPVFPDEKAFCRSCISGDAPCQICGVKIWSRAFLYFFEGTACFHYRNRLMQKAPHLIDYFNSVDQQNGTLTVGKRRESRHLPPEEALGEIKFLSDFCPPSTTAWEKRVALDNERGISVTRSSGANLRSKGENIAGRGWVHDRMVKGRLDRRLQISPPIDHENSLGFD